ncbi:hypothetical protein [Virgibacillus sp. DJP39]
MNVAPIGSPIIDPDGVDTIMPTRQASLGLEDRLAAIFHPGQTNTKKQ